MHAGNGVSESACRPTPHDSLKSARSLRCLDWIYQDCTFLYKFCMVIRHKERPLSTVFSVFEGHDYTMFGLFYRESSASWGTNIWNNLYNLSHTAHSGCRNQLDCRCGWLSYCINIPKGLTWHVTYTSRPIHCPTLDCSARFLDRWYDLGQVLFIVKLMVGNQPIRWVSANDNSVRQNCRPLLPEDKSASPGKSWRNLFYPMEWARMWCIDEGAGSVFRAVGCSFFSQFTVHIKTHSIR